MCVDMKRRMFSKCTRSELFCCLKTTTTTKKKKKEKENTLENKTSENNFDQKI